VFGATLYSRWSISVAIAAAAVRARLVQRVTVFEYERGIRYDRGRFTAVVPPGRYTIVRRRTVLRRSTSDRPSSRYRARKS